MEERTQSWPEGDGEMAGRIRAHDWTATPLGSTECWPLSLRTVVDLLLASGFPTIALWGSDLIQIYNDGYRDLMGVKHPSGLGQPTRDCWPEVWHINEPIYARVWRGETVTFEDALYPITRSGRLEDAWFTLAYSPLKDHGAIAGVLVTVIETTDAVLDRRRLQESEARQGFLLVLSDALRPLADDRAIAAEASRLLGEHLGADRTFLTEVDEDGITLHVRDEYLREGASSVLGQYSFDQFGDFVGRELHAGRTVAVADVSARSDLGATHRATYAAVGIAAYLLVPLLHEGRLAAYLTVNHRTPRGWSEADRMVARQAADRIWTDIVRVRAEAALRGSESRFRAFVTASSDVVYRMSADWSEMCRLEGRAFLSDTDAPSATWLDRYIHPDDQSIVRAAIERAIHDRSVFELEHRVIRADGSLGWTSSRAVPILSEEGEVTEWLGAARDVTADKAARSALRKSEALRRIAMEGGGMGAWRWDLHERLVWGDARFLALWGLPPSGDAHPLSLFVDRMSSDGAAEMGEMVARAMQAGDGFDGQLEVVAGLTAGTWVRWRGRADADDPSTLHGVSFDVTEQRRSEAALRESEARLRTLVEGVPQAVWRATEAGAWTWSSPQWTAYTGLSEEQSRGDGWLAAVHPDDRERARAARGAAAQVQALEMDTRVLHASTGSYRWFQTRALPVRDGAGAVTEWLGTSTDVQDLHELQGRQQVLVAELQHRTRNLMSVVQSMFEDTLQSTGDLHAFTAEYRDRIRALARVQGLLSRLNNGDRVTFDALIRDEMRAIGAPSEGDKVTLEGPPGIALRSSTVQTFALAIHELATNALKYGALKQPAGRLAVTWRLAPAGSDEHPWLHVDWIESGVGMPAGGSAPQGTGQGRELIEHALPYQLGAITIYVMADDGVRCSIAVPVSSRMAAEETDDDRAPAP